jgi:hypothetical protein
LWTGRSTASPPGRTGVYAEVLTTSGAQELGVRRLPGAVEVTQVGDKSEVAAGTGPEDPAARNLSRATSHEGCADPANTDVDHKATGTLDYGFRASKTPPGLTRFAAGNAIRGGGLNVSDTKSNRRLRHRAGRSEVRGGGRRPLRHGQRPQRRRLRRPQERRGRRGLHPLRGRAWLRRRRRRGRQDQPGTLPMDREARLPVVPRGLPTTWRPSWRTSGATRSASVTSPRGTTET